MQRIETYLDVYERYVSPRLKEMDTLMKLRARRLSPSDLCRILDISQDELSRVCAETGITTVNASHLPMLLSCGDSEICRLFKREISCGSPNTYKAADVSYIYEIPIEAVRRAFEAAGLAEVTSYTLPLVFSLLII